MKRGYVENPDLNKMYLLMSTQGIARKYLKKGKMGLSLMKRGYGENPDLNLN